LIDQRLRYPPRLQPSNQHAGTNQRRRDAGAEGMAASPRHFQRGLRGQQGRRFRMLALLVGFPQRIEDV